MLLLAAFLACKPAPDPIDTADTGPVAPGPPSLVATFSDRTWTTASGDRVEEDAAWRLRAWGEDDGLYLQIEVEGAFAGPGTYPIRDVRWSQTTGTGNVTFAYGSDGAGAGLEVVGEVRRWIEVMVDEEIPLELTTGEGGPASLQSLAASAWPPGQ
jgi:hypothetical protein